MDKREIKLNIKLEQKDFLVLQAREFFGSPMKVMGMLAMIALFVWAIYYYTLTKEQLKLVLITALPVLAYGASIVYFVPKNAKQQYQTSSYVKKQPLFIFNQDTLSIERESGNISQIKLADLSAAWEKAKYFYFYITKNNVITLPKRLLTEEDISFLSQTLKEALPRAKRKNPYRIRPVQFIINFLIVAFIAFSISMIIWSFTSGANPGQG